MSERFIQGWIKAQSDEVLEAFEKYTKLKAIWSEEERRKNMEDYKVRMIEEYRELKQRYNKLHSMIVKYEAGTLEFKPDCPIELLTKQKRIMGEYLHVLEVRAEIERVDLTHDCRTCKYGMHEPWHKPCNDCTENHGSVDRWESL